MNSDTTENAIEAIEIMEQKKFDKQEILKLLKALDDRNRVMAREMAREVSQPIVDKVQELEIKMITWRQEMLTRKQAVWLVSVVGTILAILILTYPGVLIKILTSDASPLS